MEICFQNHDEIVHTSHGCPLCEANEKIKELESDIEDLENDIQNLIEERDNPQDIRE